MAFTLAAGLEAKQELADTPPDDINADPVWLQEPEEREDAPVTRGAS